MNLQFLLDATTEHMGYIINNDRHEVNIFYGRKFPN